MAKVHRIYEARIPITHFKGDSRAEWVVGVQKVGRTYTAYGFEYAFSYIDDEIIQAIFEKYTQLLESMFADFFVTQSVTRKATWAGLGDVNTYLVGIKSEATALQVAKWLEAVASNALKAVPANELDRHLLYRSGVKINAIDIVRRHSTPP